MKRRKRILVVDDEAPNRELLGTLVMELGHDVDEAEEGLVALEKLSPSHDLVLLDARMNGIDGFEVARRIRSRSSVPDIPICMVTVYSSMEERLRAVESGANDFIVKPVDKTELKVRTAALLKAKEAQDEIKRCQAKLAAQNRLLRENYLQLHQENLELKRFCSRARRLAIVDDLTHRYNRRGFFDSGRREVDRARRAGTPLAAIVFDLDQFKLVNDAAGHSMGDKVLKVVASRCLRELRKVDILCRCGGDEFSVLLPATDLAGARLVAERLRRCALEPIRGASGSVSITMSLGLAVLEDNARGLEDLLKSADEALLRAKRSGRNRACADEGRQGTGGIPSGPVRDRAANRRTGR